MQGIHHYFIEFIKSNHPSIEIQDILRIHIQEFLTQFNSSPTYYMNKRRDLGVLFSQISKNIGIQLNVVKSTDRKKVKAHLHKIYVNEQLHNVLDYLKSHHMNLYVCCLISYGCLLRPHHEVRLLTKGHFKNYYSEIHLSGEENKSGRVRIVNVPYYISAILSPVLNDLDDEDNIFTQTKKTFNLAYFNTAWTRCHNKMQALKLVEKNHTIYSFRHTAAVNVYKNTKDLHVLKQLLGHSDMIVTLKYLRGLGVHNTEELKHVMPEL